MVKVEIINNGEGHHNNITCISCMSQDNEISYGLRIFNPYGESKILLCKECLDQLKTELEFLEVVKEDSEDLNEEK